MFTDRREAGEHLAEVLRGRLSSDALVLGVPRGGVVVAAEVARALGLELDVVVVRKIGAPANPEYAIGAVDEDGEVIGGAEAAVDPGYVQRAAEEGRAEIVRRLAAYRGDRPRARIRGREVVIVDDGIATGMTLRAAVESLKRRGASRVLIAAPVAAAESVRMLREVADEVVVPEMPARFWAVGQHYRRFDQTTDTEVIGLLQDAWR